jgi:hypothetical protein
MARHAAEHLSHSRVIAVPYGTHSTGAACIDNLFVRFIDTASVTGLDASCVDQSHNPACLTLDQAEKGRVR